MEDQRLVEVLEEAQRRGFLGPGPARFVVEHSVGLAAAVGEPPSQFLDLGAGGGVPGLVLALEWPDAQGVLLDSRQRSCLFLADAIEQLALGERVTVACGRAEDLARQKTLREAFELVVARSFGPPAVTAECAVGFLTRSGGLIVSEPPASTEERWPAAGLRTLGLTGAQIRHVGGTTVAVLKRTGALGDRWPRRPGIPAKRPLW